jgi:chaperonin GroES
MLKPLGARVLVQRLEAEEKSSGGIILPEAAQERPREGTVIAVGPGEIGDDGEPMGMSVDEGDVVIYASFGGTEVSIDGEDYLIINENDILAVRE